MPRCNKDWAAQSACLILIDETPQVQDAPNAIPLPPVEGHITFENVSFHYATGDEVLHGINLEIAPGEVLALVGPSGAGKAPFST